MESGRTEITTRALPSALRALPFVLAALPLLYLIWFVATLYVDVPFGDQWELVPRLEHLHSGMLTFRDIWGQHNEHRPAFPVLLMLALASASKWRIGWEIAVNVLAGLGILLVFAAHIRDVSRTEGARVFWALPVVSLLVFSPVQWENWMWGWQMGTFIGVLTTIGGLRLLSSGDRRWHLVAAQVCGVVSTYSYVAGLAYWVVGLGVMAFRPVHRRSARLASWMIVAGLTIASYFYDYHQPPNNAPLLSVFSSLENLLRVMSFASAYLGSPVGAYDQRIAAIFGAFVVVACAGLLVRLRSSWREPAFVFPAALVVQTLAMAGLAALGRSNNGMAQALAPRYTTVSIPIWIALVLLGALAVHRRTATSARTWAVAGALAVALVTTSIASGAYGYRIAAAHSAYKRIARRGLIIGRSDALLLRLYPDVTLIRQRRATLIRFRTSVFRHTAPPD